MRNTIHRTWLYAACALAAVGCTSGDPETQVLTGRVQTTGALAVRAVADDTVITAATVHSDGSFTMSLPVGQHYRLEVLTTSGVRHVVATKDGSLTALTFTVCDPTAPFDVGGIGPNDGTMGGGGMGGGGQPCDVMDPDCKPTPCGPNDPMCEPPPPWPCGPNDPTCQPPTPCDPMTNPNDPMCEPPPPPPCDPGDPNCWGCDPMTDPTCEPPPPPCEPGDPTCEPPPPPCDPTTDPMCNVCAFGSMDPNCQPPPCMDPTDPYCWCDANGDCPPPTCQPGDLMCPPPPPPPCMDPMDPNTCKDPCVNDPASCGCSTMDANCWPPPQPPDCMLGMCDPNGGWMTPDHPPFDFGCKDSTAP